jgi:hypothetical protein
MSFKGIIGKSIQNNGGVDFTSTMTDLALVLSRWNVVVLSPNSRSGAQLSDSIEMDVAMLFTASTRVLALQT